VILPDVNVLVYALRKDSEAHESYHRWLRSALNVDEVLLIADIVLNSVVRIVTNPRIYMKPSTFEETFEFCDRILDAKNTVRISPGPRHWSLFCGYCKLIHPQGSLVTDSYLAGLAAENDAELISTDSDFSKYPGLRYKHPLG